MEAFPAIFLATDDAVLADAIPQQLSHAQLPPCQLHGSWDDVLPLLSPAPPSLFIADTAMDGFNLQDLEAIQAQHPLLAVIAIAPVTPHAALSEWFSSRPLSTLLARPLSMPALVRSLQHLAYERTTTAGQQALQLTENLRLLAAEKRLDADKRSAELTDKEVAILLCLYHYRQTAIPRSRLLEQVWGYNESIDTHTLETHLYRLRQKLKDLTGADGLIETAQGHYRLRTS